ncbi:MAG: ParB N-terminal domain-containing protein, partial [Pseudomonadota bacterium]
GTFETANPAPARAPIAQVAGDAAVSAAFEEVQAELVSARRDGRMVLRLLLDDVVEDHLIRDRIECNVEDLETLKASLRTRGQQTPIEVTELGNGRYGLISGWRRLRALRELSMESEDAVQHSTVLALVRTPEDRPAAYLAMVEENEIRADLSFYERARIVVQAVEAGVFKSDKAALQSLFASATFSRRSKIKSFMPLVRQLDTALRYPGQIPERLGLKLSKAIEERPEFLTHLVAVLKSAKIASSDDERRVLEHALKRTAQLVGADRKKSDAPLETLDLGQGLRMHVRKDKVEIEGARVTDDLITSLRAWLVKQC